MPRIEWDPAHDTGIRSIDHEHRRLLDLLNEVDVQDAAGAAPRAIAGMLAEFHSLATAHLALEERILAEIDDPAYAQRRRQHYRLLDQVRDIMDGYERGDFAQASALPDALVAWLKELIALDALVFDQIDDERLKNWGLSR